MLPHPNLIAYNKTHMELLVPSFHCKLSIGFRLSLSKVCIVQVKIQAKAGRSRLKKALSGTICDECLPHLDIPTDCAYRFHFESLYREISV